MEEIIIRFPDWEYGDEDALRKFLGLEKAGFDALDKDGLIFDPDLSINRQQKYWSRILAGKIALVLPEMIRLKAKLKAPTDA